MRLLIAFLAIGILVTPACKKNADDPGEDPIPVLNKIIFYMLASNGSTDIFEIKDDGTSRNNLTQSSTKNETFPSWSHDAKRIAYSRDGDIYHINVDGTDEVKVTGTALYTATHPRWNSNSTVITIHDNDSDPYVHYLQSKYNEANYEGYDSYVLGNQRVPHFPSFSPSQNDRLVLINYADSPFDQYDIRYSGPEGQGDQSTWKRIHSTTDEIRETRFSPNGEKIVMSIKTGPSFDIWIINTDGSNLFNLTNDQWDNREPAFSPDGTKICYASNAGSVDYNIWIMNSDGANKAQLTSDPEDERAPDWK